MRWRRGRMGLALAVLVAPMFPGATFAQTPSAAVGGGYSLRSVGGGDAYHYDGPHFSATVAGDGSVTFEDKKIHGAIGGLPGALGRKQFSAADVGETVPPLDPVAPYIGA